MLSSFGTMFEFSLSNAVKVANVELSGVQFAGKTNVVREKSCTARWLVDDVGIVL